VTLENGQYVNESDGIATAVATNRQAEAIYSVNGMRMHQLVRGMNIVRQGDGSVKKIFIK
jgi:hypothetical protein